MVKSESCLPDTSIVNYREAIEAWIGEHELTKSSTGVNIYLHVPFCRRRCDFCYVPIKKNNAEQIERYVSTAIREIKAWAGSGEKLRVRSVVIGGGTPSLLSAQQVRRIFDVISECFDVPDNCVKSMEVNPEDVTLELASNYVLQGVNRFSLATQSFQTDVLQRLNRGYDDRGIEKAVRSLKDAEAKDVGIELMWDIPPFGLDSSRKDISRAMELEPDFIILNRYDVDAEGREGFPSPKGHSRPERDLTSPKEAQIQFYLEHLRALKEVGYRRSSTEEFRAKNFDHALSLTLAGPGIGFTNYGPLIGFGSDSISSSGSILLVGNRNINEYIEDTFSYRTCVRYDNSDLVWFRLVTDLIMCQGPVFDYFDFAPSQKHLLENWFEKAKAAGVVRIDETQQTYELTDFGAGWYTAKLEFENNDVIQKMKESHF
jgi:coproporphyrinogen III oxidase-like Fe-S oxidoreductase